MLGSMEVPLQRELATRLHDDTLDLVTVADVHALVIAPWTVDATVLDRGSMFVGLELFDKRLHLLGLGTRGDQYRIAPWTTTMTSSSPTTAVSTVSSE